MKRQFKTGDRVVVYSNCETFRYFGNSRQTGVVYLDRGGDIIKVEIDDTASQDSEGHNAVVRVNRMQCYHLVKKSKHKPRTIWVNEYPFGDKCCHETKEEADFYSRPKRITCIEFREVNRGKK